MTAVQQNKLQPFLKWAGGKRWLVANKSELFPKDWENYYEPFLGGGAVFFSLKPQTAVLNDVNSELIKCYKTIKNSWSEVRNELEMHHYSHSKDYYYEVRALKPSDPISHAARFIYLNRTCWNGLYRVNMNGDFNVPIGTKINALLDSDDFENISLALKNVELTSEDFEITIRNASSGDFIFADPPYTVKHNFNGFVKYNEQFFHWEDQIRLRDCLVSASARGCKVMLTNANHPSVKELYQNHFEIIEVERSSVIAASSKNRGMYAEIIARNF